MKYVTGRAGCRVRRAPARLVVRETRVASTSQNEHGARVYGAPPRTGAPQAAAISGSARAGGWPRTLAWSDSESSTSQAGDATSAGGVTQSHPNGKPHL